MLLTPVLTYHRVAPATGGLCVLPDKFLAQMQWLNREGYRTVTLSSLSLRPKRPAATKLVALTFDDGYKDAIWFVAPILARLGMVGTFFVVTGWLGGTVAPYDEYLTGPGKGFLTPEDVRELSNMGMEIGSHTRTHPLNLSSMQPEAVRSEVKGSKIELEDLLGSGITSFCYPAGFAARATQRIVEESGYQRAAATHPEFVEGPGNHSFALLRHSVWFTNGVREFSWRVRWWYPYLEHARAHQVRLRNGGRPILSQSGGFSA